MDPVSITCAVVTLATALKDLIELGITLKEFCERVTNNNEELVRLAAQIPTDLEELERLYLQNPNHMEQKSELKEAIGKLTQKVQMIYAKVQNLKLNHSKHGIISWTKIKAPFKAPDVEREIRSLKEDISNCHQSFQTFAAIRIEAGVDEVLATSQQMQADMAEIKLQLVSFTREQRFEITHMKVGVRHQLTALDSDSPAASRAYCPTIREPLQSCTADYIGYELDNIAEEVAKLALLDPTIVLKKPTRPFVVHFGRFHSFHRTPRQRDRALLEETLRLLNSLEETGDAVNEHAYSLTLLGEYFGSLLMDQEASMASTWAVDLYRILIKIYPEEYAPYLSDALCNLSHYGAPPNDTGLTLAKEAIEILRPVINPLASNDLHCELAFALTRHSFLLSISAGFHEEAQRTISEALDIYENLLSQQSGVNIKRIVRDVKLILQISTPLAQSLHTGLNANLLATPKDDFNIMGSNAYICGYAEALRRASSIAVRFGLCKKAKEYLLKALLCERHLASVYPGTSLELNLADCWTRLALLDRSVVPAEEALGYVDEALCIYRRVCGYYPKKYTSNLFNCLNDKAQILSELERPDEAYKCLLNVLDVDTERVDQINIAHSLFDTSTCLSHFGRKEEAIDLRIRTLKIYRVIQKTPNHHEANLYLELALDYKSENQIDNAIKAADAAFQQFLALALDSPLEHARLLGESLSTCINLLTSRSNPAKTLHRLDQVITTLDHYDSLVRHDATLYEAYYTLMSVLVDYSDDPSVAIPLSSEMIERLRRLAQSYPKTVGTALLDRSMYHGQLLSKFGRLKDAVDWLEGLGAKYHGLASTDAEIGQWYIELLLDLAHMLKDQGAMEKARVVLRRATETGSMHPNIGLVLSCVAKSHEADIVACLGDSSPALNLSTDCLSLALQFYPLHDINIALLQHQHSQLVAVNEIYEEALSNAKDSATIMLNYITDDPAKLDRYRYHWLSEFWRVWASCLSDTNGPAPALILAGQGAKEANRVKAALRKNLYLCKISESYLGLALWTLGSIQLFSRNTDDAQKSLEEAKELWKARVEVRRFDLRNFALTLWALGFTYCLLGRHDDGASVHQELKKMINGLIYAEPTMHRVVKVALDQERRRPSWALFLEKVREELQCKHLMDVVPNAKIE